MNMKHSTKLATLLMAATLIMPVLSMAATVDMTKGANTGYPANMMGRVYLLENTLDFSKVSGYGVSGSTYQALNIPAGCMVLKVGYKLETGNTAACTVDIGDGTTPAGYFDDANVIAGQAATAVSTWTMNTTPVVSLASDTLGQTSANYVTSTVPTTVTMEIVRDTVTTATTNFMVVDSTFATISTNTITYVTGLTPVTNTYTVLTNQTFLTKAGVATASLTQTTNTNYPITSAAASYSNGKLYTSADTIDVLLNNTATQLKLTVRALVVPIGDR